MKIGHRRVREPTSRALALCQSLWRRAEAQNVSFSTLYGGQSTLSTQSIILKLPCYTLPPTQHHSFFRNLPPLLTELLPVFRERNRDYSWHALAFSRSVPRLVYRDVRQTVQQRTMKHFKHFEPLPVTSIYFLLQSCIAVTRIEKVILLVRNLGDAQRTVWRIYILMLDSKRLKHTRLHVCDSQTNI